MTSNLSHTKLLRRVAGAAGSLLVAFMLVTPAYAQAPAPSAAEAGTGKTTTSNPQSPNSAAAPKKTQLYDPLNGANVTTLVARATLGFMGISGTAALLFFVYGGFQMITSGGNEKKYAAGLNSLKWAVIGLFVIFGSYALLNTLFNALGAAAS